MQMKLNWYKTSRREAGLTPRTCVYPTKSFSGFKMFSAPVAHGICFL